MPRRKKLRMTPKSKPPKRTVQDGILSAHEFATLTHGYGSFVTKDTDGELLTFYEGDVAYIQHQELGDAVVVPEEDYWIGKIEEIRGDDGDDVWVRVQWFWSPQEVAEVVKSFNPAICGRREKLSSNNLDIISVYSFVCHVDVKLFDETSIHQSSIGEDEWFTRYTFLYVQRRISPKVTHDACSICKVPYTPGVEKILHFCPRPSCRKFYHQACLIKHGYVDDTLTRRAIETWPGVDRTVSVEALCGTDDEPPKKRQKKKDHSTSLQDSDLLACLPPLLVAVAEQCMVRGTCGGSVVGNIVPVAAARQLIFQTLSEGGSVPDDWETVINVSEAFPEMDALPDCFCPSCYSRI